MNFRKPVDYIEKAFSEEEITKIYEKTKSQSSKDLDSFISLCRTQVYSDTLWRRWEHIRQMLFHLNERINYWENRRTQFLQIGLGILGASLAGITAIFANIKELSDVFLTPVTSYNAVLPTAKGLVYLFIFTLCLFFTFGSLKLVYLWNCQNNPSYPFTKGYRIWLWHYRHAERIPSDIRISGYSTKIFRKEVDVFCQNVIEYKRLFLQSSINDMIDQDLSQVYLLLVNEKYKIMMVSALRDLLIKTLLVALYVALPIAVIFALARFRFLL